MPKHRSKRRSKNLRVLGYRIPKKPVFRGLAFCFAIVALGVGGAVFYQQSKDRGITVNGEGEVAGVPVVSEMTDQDREVPATADLQAILDLHRQATGLAEVNGLILRGVYTEDGRQYETNLSIRGGEMIRKKVTGEQVEIIASTNKKEGKRRVTPTSGESIVRDMENDHYWYALILEGAFLRLVDGAVLEGYVYELQDPEDEPADEAVRKIVSTGPSGVILTHYIDLDSGFELERRLELRVDDNTHLLRQVFSDFRKVGSGQFPYHYTIEINGEERAEMQLESVQLNPGLTPWMF